MSNNDLLLQQVWESIRRLERKQDNQMEQLSRIEVQTTRTNGRVTALEKLTKKLRPEKEPSLSPRTLYLLAILSVILALIIASQLKVDVSRVLP